MGSLGTQISRAAGELARKYGRLGFGHTARRFESAYFERLYAYQDGKRYDDPVARSKLPRGGLFSSKPKAQLCQPTVVTHCHQEIGIINHDNVNDALDNLWNSGGYDLTCETFISVAFAMGTRWALGDRRFAQKCPKVALSPIVSFDDRFLVVHDESDGAFEGTPAHPSFRRMLQPGDGVYFFNPDVKDLDYWYVGENAVFLGNSLYAAWPLGVKTEDQILDILNAKRRRGATQSAHLTAYYQRVHPKVMS